MEYEVRFYYPSEAIDDILQKIRKNFATNGKFALKELPRCFEKTTQFDHPCAAHSFYSKEIDGRFRIRMTREEPKPISAEPESINNKAKFTTSGPKPAPSGPKPAPSESNPTTNKPNPTNTCLLSWKRRLPDTKTGAINKEEEVELSIQPEEYENLMFIVQNVLKMKPVESYERYRTRFVNDEVEIAVDEYPFGVALEIENKSRTGSPEKIVKKWVEKLGLDIKKAYRLSWDDKYAELCQAQGVKKYKHVKFGLPMPQIDN